jgi:hypothetical protein
MTSVKATSKRAKPASARRNSDVQAGADADEWIEGIDRRMEITSPEPAAPTTSIPGKIRES